MSRWVLIVATELNLSVTVE